MVDTPPARSALDFLDAPEHLSSLLDGRFLRLLLHPTRGPLRLMSAGFSMISAAMTKILGAQIISDVQTFVRAFEALFGGFRQRATSTFELLSSRHSTFLVVATPQHDALREAAYFVDRLTEEGMPLSGMVINRVHTRALAISPERALSLAEDLAGTSAALEVEALRRHADLMRVIEAEIANDGTLRRDSSDGGPDPGSVVADRRHRPGGTAPCRRRSCPTRTESPTHRLSRLRFDLPSRIERHEVTSLRCRSSSRRSRSVMPPQTPHSIRLSRASARHSNRTGQPEHNESGSLLI